VEGEGVGVDEPGVSSSDVVFVTTVPALMDWKSASVRVTVWL
jgi:hypothetical protein